MWRSVLAVALVGCGQGKTDPAAVTWHQDIAPLVVERCAGCHATGNIGPFSLETYAQAEPLAEAMLAAIEDGTMPPFLAQDTDDCKPLLPWANDLRWNADEIAMLRAWVDAGTPEGDATTASAIVTPAVPQLPREDIVVALPAPIEVSGSKDMHTCVVVDPGLAEDSYVTGRLITAGNDRVLHHVVSWILQPGYKVDGSRQTKAELEAAVKAEKGAGIGERYDCFGGVSFETVETELLDAWAPGGLPSLAPPDSGQPVARDALVLLDMHYHPTGGVEVDSTTKLSLMLADTRPSLISQTVLLGNFGQTLDTDFGIGEPVKQPGETTAEFLIPAGASNHVEEMTWTWKLAPGLELSTYGVGTHMHYVGRDMQVSLERKNPGGQAASECLIQTPAWDFNWQRGYNYDAPIEALPTMKDGDVLRFRCVFDNSMGNPFVVDALADQGLDAPVDVRLGEDTLDEMCLAAVAITYPNF